jgi:transcriptional regulator with XRE-family HTH domain
LDVADLRAAIYAAHPLEKLPPPERRKAIRVAAGVTVEDAAKAMGIDPARLEQWETRVSPRVSASYRYRKLLAALETPKDQPDNSV